MWIDRRKLMECQRAPGFRPVPGFLYRSSEIFRYVLQGVLLLGTVIILMGIPGAAEGATLSWSQPVNISVSNADSANPAIAVVNGHLHVVWEEDGQLIHRYQTDTGWSAATVIGSGSEPALVADGGGRLHLVYVDVFGGNAEILYRSWDTGGWGAAVNVSVTTAASATPSIALAPDGHRHVVWVENALTDPWVFYAESGDGLTWQSSPVPDAFGTGPDVAVDLDGNPHIIWVEPYTFDDPLELFYTRWTGSKWTIPEDVSETPDTESTAGSLVLAGGKTPWATWQETIAGRTQVWTASRATAGWGAPFILPGDDLTEPLLVEDGLLAQVWISGGDTLQVHRFDGVWGPAEEVWQDAGGISQPALALGADGTAWAAWVGAGPTASDIFVSQGHFGSLRKMYLPLQLHRGS